MAAALSRPDMVAAFKWPADGDSAVGRLAVAAADALQLSRLPERTAQELARQLAPALPAALTALAQAAESMASGVWALLPLRETATLLQLVALDAEVMDAATEDDRLPYAQTLTSSASEFLVHLTMHISSGSTPHRHRQ